MANLLLATVTPYVQCTSCHSHHEKTDGKVHLRLASWEYMGGLSRASARNYKHHTKTLCGEFPATVWKHRENDVRAYVQVEHTSLELHGFCDGVPMACVGNPIDGGFPKAKQCQDCLQSEVAIKLRDEIKLVPDHFLECDKCGTWLHAQNSNYITHGPYYSDGGGTIDLDEYLDSDVGSLDGQAQAIRNYQDDCEVICIPCHHSQYPITYDPPKVEPPAQLPVSMNEKDMKALEKVYLSFLQERANSSRLMGGTQYYTIQMERYTLEGLQSGGGLTECNICGLTFETSIFLDPEFHKGCDLGQNVEPQIDS